MAVTVRTKKKTFRLDREEFVVFINYLSERAKAHKAFLEDREAEEAAQKKN